MAGPQLVGFSGPQTTQQLNQSTDFYNVSSQFKKNAIAFELIKVVILTQLQDAAEKNKNSWFGKDESYDQNQIAAVNVALDALEQAVVNYSNTPKDLGKIVHQLKNISTDSQCMAGLDILLQNELSQKIIDHAGNSDEKNIVLAEELLKDGWPVETWLKFILLNTLDPNSKEKAQEMLSVLNGTAGFTTRLSYYPLSQKFKQMRENWPSLLAFTVGLGVYGHYTAPWRATQLLGRPRGYSLSLNEAAVLSSPKLMNRPLAHVLKNQLAFPTMAGTAMTLSEALFGSKIDPEEFIRESAKNTLMFILLPFTEFAVSRISRLVLPQRVARAGEFSLREFQLSQGRAINFQITQTLDKTTEFNIFINVPLAAKYVFEMGLSTFLTYDYIDFLDHQINKK